MQAFWLQDSMQLVKTRLMQYGMINASLYGGEMSAEVSCANCGRQVGSHNRFCPYCGADLVMAALLAEPDILVPKEVLSQTPLVPEILVPRIGETMIQQGYLQPDDLKQALAFQKEMAGKEHPLLLGQALLELGLVDRETLDQVITYQILNLQNALSEANRNLTQRVEERTRELQEALARLSELSQLKSNFIANISHELRTPLTHIKGYIDLLNDEGLGPLNESQNNALAVIQRAEERLEGLIEDLIQFSLATRGELSLQVKPYNIEVLAQASADQSTIKAENKGVLIETHLEEKSPDVEIDEEKISWVVQHLLDNAIKFTPKGGRVLISVANENGLVTLSVADTGIGIPAERIGEIFEPFHQLDGSSTRKFGGTGLGLAMAQRIVEAHGSKIEVNSKVGVGTQFCFSLACINEKSMVAG
jgi:signal transduction histidine kinase